MSDGARVCVCCMLVCLMIFIIIMACLNPILPDTNDPICSEHHITNNNYNITIGSLQNDLEIIQSYYNNVKYYYNNTLVSNIVFNVSTKLMHMNDCNKTTRLILKKINGSYHNILDVNYKEIGYIRNKTIIISNNYYNYSIQDDMLYISQYHPYVPNIIGYLIFSSTNDIFFIN